MGPWRTQNKLPQLIGIPDWQPMHKTKFKTGKHKFRDGAKSRATKRKTHINKHKYEHILANPA